MDSIKIYTCPLWKADVSASWESASGLASMPAYHAFDNDRNSFFGTSLATNSSAFLYNLIPEEDYTIDALYVKWDNLSNNTHLYMTYYDPELPPAYNAVFSHTNLWSEQSNHVTWVSSGMNADDYTLPGYFLVHCDEFNCTYTQIRLRFIGSGTAYLNYFLPLHYEDTLPIPTYATTIDSYVSGGEVFTTLTGKISSSSKGLDIRQKFVILYEYLRTDDKNALLQLYQSTVGGLFPILLNINDGDIISLALFDSAPEVTEDEAGLWTVTFDLGGI